MMDKMVADLKTEQEEEVKFKAQPMQYMIYSV